MPATTATMTAVDHPHVWTIEIESFDTERHLHGVYLSAHAAHLAVVELAITRFAAEWAEYDTLIPARADYLRSELWQQAVIDAWEALPTSAAIVTTEHAPAGIPTPPARFDYAVWRHGGWYVRDVRHPSGAIGCVSRNYPDKQWRIACDPRPFNSQPTFPTRDAAAMAEWRLAHGLDRIPTDIG